MTGQNQRDKRRILFVNDEMEMGGVARVLNTLMKNLDQQVYQIDLLVLHKTGTLLQDIPEGVRVIEGTSFFNAVDSPLKELLKKGDLPHLFSKLRLLLYMKTGLIRRKCCPASMMWKWRRKRGSVQSLPLMARVSGKLIGC